MIENIINDIEDDDQQLFEHWKVQVDEGQTPVRIDKYLAEKNPYQSRNRIQNAADAGFIQVNGTPVKSNYKVRPKIFQLMWFMRTMTLWLLIKQLVW